MLVLIMIFALFILYIGYTLEFYFKLKRNGIRLTISSLICMIFLLYKWSNFVNINSFFSYLLKPQLLFVILETIIVFGLENNMIEYKDNNSFKILSIKQKFIRDNYIICVKKEMEIP